MVSHALNAHVKQSRTISVFLWFNADTALKEGQGVCYDYNYGTAADYDARRFNHVEVPTILNAQYFAGVAARPYAAVIGGQFIEIFLPGSICNIWTTVDTVIGVGTLTVQAAGANAGMFTSAIGLEGRGTAEVMQTVTAGSGSLAMARLQDGPESGLQETVVIATAGGAVTGWMIGGTTTLDLTALTDADATIVLADAAKGPGQRKAFYVSANAAANNVVITVTSGTLWAGTALSTITMDGLTDLTSLEWSGLGAGATWVVRANVGSVLA